MPAAAIDYKYYQHHITPPPWFAQRYGLTPDWWKPSPAPAPKRKKKRKPRRRPFIHFQNMAEYHTLLVAAIQDEVHADKRPCPWCGRDVHPDNFRSHKLIYHADELVRDLLRGARGSPPLLPQIRGLVGSPGLDRQIKGAAHPITKEKELTVNGVLPPSATDINIAVNPAQVPISFEIGTELRLPLSTFPGRAGSLRRPALETRILNGERWYRFDITTTLSGGHKWFRQSDLAAINPLSQVGDPPAVSVSLPAPHIGNGSNGACALSLSLAPLAVVPYGFWTAVAL